MSDWESAPVISHDDPMQPQQSDGGWQSAPEVTSDAPGHVQDAASLDKYLQNTPQMRTAQNPLDAFFAGLQLSASGLLTGKPDMVMPANASFYMKLTGAVGLGLGDLPFNFAGAIGGAAAGGAATSETGGWGALPGGGAGAMALPEAVRQVLLDRYEKKANRTWGEFAHDVGVRSWEVGKQAVLGAILPKPAQKAGELALSATGSQFVKTTATVTTFGAGATAVNGALNGQVPDAQDFTISMINAVGWHAAGTFVGGKFTPSPTGERVQKNMETIYRNTGIPPWEQADRAKRDPVFEQEILAQDVNGDPVTPKFYTQRPTSMDEQVPKGVVEGKGPEPAGFRTNAHKVRDEHNQEVSDIITQAHTDMTVDELLKSVRTLEDSGEKAVSPKGAIGRHQIMPGTARQYGFDPEKLFDPAYNERVARAILADLSRRFKGDTEAILTAYNAGPGVAIRFLRDGKDYSELPRETQKYLARAGFRDDGGEPPKPPEPPADAAGEPDFGKLNTDMRVSRFQDAIGQEPEAKSIWSLSRLTRQWVSELETARAIDREMVTRGVLDPETQLTTEDMFRQTYASDARASHFFYRGPIDPVTFAEKEGPSLQKVIEEVHRVGGNIDEFNMYRVSLRTVEKAKQGVDTGVFKGGVAEAQANANDPNLRKYAAANEMMQQFKNGTLEYGRDSGLFSQKQIEAMQRMNTSHVSLARVMGDDAAFNFGSGFFGRTFKVRNPVREMEGSDRQIIQPLTADMDNARRIIRMADRNRAIGHLVGSTEAADVLGLKKIAAPEPKATLAEAGSDVFKPYNMTNTEMEALAPFVMRAKQGGLKDNQFLFYRDGKAEIWEAKNAEVAQLLRGAESKGEANLILKMAQWPAMMMRAGTVFMPDFALRVGAANELAAYIMDPSHPTPFLTFMKGALEPWKKSDTFWDWIRHGGGGVALRDLDQTYVTRDFQKMLDDTGADNAVWNAVKHPIQLAQIVNERLDTAPRIGVYKSLVAKGIDPTKAAMVSRRASLDYAERGTAEIASIMSKTIPFFRASLLGLNQMKMGFQKDPMGAGLRLAAASIMPSVMLFLLNHEADKGLDDKDKYSSIPQEVRDMYFITPPIGGVRFKMRRPFQVGFTGALTDRFLAAELERDPHAFDEWAKTILKDNLPPLTPTVVQPVYEGMSNYNIYSGRPLIPDSLKDATADMQYTDYTSEAAKQVSALIGSHTGLGLAEVSPMVLDNYVREWGGAMGFQVLKALDTPLGKDTDKPFEAADLPFVSGFVMRNPKMSTKLVNDFYDEAEKFEALHQDKVLEVKQGNIQQAIEDQLGGGQKVVFIERVKHALAVQRAALQALQKNEQMSVDEKRQLSERIYNDAIAIARFGMKGLRGEVSNEEATQLGEQVQQNVEATGYNPNPQVPQ